MFFAACGTVPAIFSKTSIPANWHRGFDLGIEYQRVIMLDILTTAKRTSRFAQIPNAPALYAAIKAPIARKRGKKKRMQRGVAKLLADLGRKLAR